MNEDLTLLSMGLTRWQCHKNSHSTLMTLHKYGGIRNKAYFKLGLYDTEYVPYF